MRIVVVVVAIVASAAIASIAKAEIAVVVTVADSWRGESHVFRCGAETKGVIAGHVPVAQRSKILFWSFLMLLILQRSKCRHR